jgi:hypothetical protein
MPPVVPVYATGERRTVTGLPGSSYGPLRSIREEGKVSREEGKVISQRVGHAARGAGIRHR